MKSDRTCTIDPPQEKYSRSSAKKELMIAYILVLAQVCLVYS